jgi:two-component system OmpR family response regulator
MGSDDFLVKPREIGELSARLRALIRRSSQVVRNQLVCGKIELNLATKEVVNCGEVVVLTALEYSLVEHLMMRMGRVVSRSELYAHLFDEEADSLSNHLDVHVCNIRKKLGSDSIETRRGQGYVMGAGVL